MAVNVAAPPDNREVIPPGAVYLIAAPGLVQSTSGRWNRLHRELTGLLTGIPLFAWADLTKQLSLKELPGLFAGAVVVPAKRQGRYFIGTRAREEAKGFTEAGRQVLVYAGGRLIPWPSCTTRRAKPKQVHWAPIEVVVPEARS